MLGCFPVYSTARITASPEASAGRNAGFAIQQMRLLCLLEGEHRPIIHIIPGPGSLDRNNAEQKQETRVYWGLTWYWGGDE